ncbi:energy-coupling factor transporter transmembrane component T [Propionimicrobium sp. PCR01-08-3]|uniref:energy-coupling factor transporter transmembrane component T family protein n=1 Tax=Propionimicrobium sp. PCR01-08-3 TaxID=3052086 RepID=UPI00255CE33A|nr:energy-coupling factor transporter transmembrane component T [Propionimicrobium sp. PCR01-08-3]WIY82348.1 energy-coupling factor transporter transmembrane component T [Propionimicrobium sp. PCR01-08-3]
MSIGINTLGLYRQGTSVIHRAPAGAKLALLLGLGVASVWLQTRWWLVLVVLGVVFAAYLVAGFPLGLMLKQLRPMWWLLIFIAAMNWWSFGWQKGIAVPGMIAMLVAAAGLVTLTTPMSRLIEVVVWAAGPLRKVGVDPDRVGLTLMLGIRCVPVVAGLAREVREAQIARAATTSFKAFAVPLMVRALRDAEAMGDALVARGFDD